MDLLIVSFPLPRLQTDMMCTFILLTNISRVVPSFLSVTLKSDIPMNDRPEQPPF